MDPRDDDAYEQSRALMSDLLVSWEDVEQRLNQAWEAAGNLPWRERWKLRKQGIKTRGEIVQHLLGVVSGP